MTLSDAVLLRPPARRWWCPNCPATAVTHEAQPHTRMHECRSGGPTAGLWAPMLLVGQRGKVEAVEREDYVGRETVQTSAHGRPVMNVTVTRDDGQDCTVYAPCATANVWAG